MRELSPLSMVLLRPRQQDGSELGGELQELHMWQNMALLSLQLSCAVPFLSAARNPSKSYLFDSLSDLLNPSQGCCFDDVYSWEPQVANYKFLHPLFLFPFTNHLSTSFMPAYVCPPTTFSTPKQSKLQHPFPQLVHRKALVGTGSSWLKLQFSLVFIVTAMGCSEWKME